MYCSSSDIIPVSGGQSGGAGARERLCETEWCFHWPCWFFVLLLEVFLIIIFFLVFFGFFLDTMSLYVVLAVLELDI